MDGKSATPPISSGAATTINTSAALQPVAAPVVNPATGMTPAQTDTAQKMDLFKQISGITAGLGDQLGKAAATRYQAQYANPMQPVFTPTPVVYTPPVISAQRRQNYA